MKPKTVSCPFCGEYSDFEVTAFAEHAFFVSCPGCECEGPIAHSERGAIDRWNRRSLVITGASLLGEIQEGGEDVEIEDLNLEYGIDRKLARKGIKFVSDLENKTEAEILSIPGIGHVGVHSLRRALYKIGSKGLIP